MEEIIIKGIDEKILYDRCDNGLGIYMWVNEKVNNYYMTLNVKYGSLDTEFKVKGRKKSIKVPNGIAHFLEHIKFNVEDGKTANDFYNQYGLSINAFTTFKYTAYEVFGNTNFNESLDYLLEYVCTPYFTEEIIEKEKGIICEEVKMGKNNPSSKLYFGSYQAVLHNDKHRNLVTGEEDDVRATTLEDILNVYDNFYQPQNMFVVITGNFNPYEAAAIVKKKVAELEFSDYLNPKVIEPEEPKTVVEREKIIEANVEIPKAKVFYKIPVSNFKFLDEVELRTYIGIIMRSNFGASSDLKEELMEKELITALGYNRDIINDYLLICISIESKYLDEVIKIVMEKFENMVVDKEMLQRRRRANIASLINDFDDIEYVNTEIQDNIIEYGRVIDNMYEVYNNVNLETISKVIASIITSNYSVIKMVPLSKDNEEE